jgi:hypothetical protein
VVFFELIVECAQRSQNFLLVESFHSPSLASNGAFGDRSLERTTARCAQPGESAHPPPGNKRVSKGDNDGLGDAPSARADGTGPGSLR